MRKLYRAFACCFLTAWAMFISYPAAAQSKNSPDKIEKAVWVSISGGMGASNFIEDIFAFMWNGNYQHNNLLISIRSLEGVSGFTIISFPFSLFTSTENNDEVSEYAFMAGWATRSSNYHASVTAGISTVTFSSVAVFSDDRESRTVIGLPWEAQLFLKVTRHFGIGIGAYGNLNKEHSFGGITAGIHIGKLR